MGKNVKRYNWNAYLKNVTKLKDRKSVLKMWNSCLYSMADIARLHKCSRERVRQVIEVVRASGVSVLTHKQWVRKRLEARDFSFKCLRESAKWDITSYKSPRSSLLKRKLGKLGIGKKCEICGWNKFVEALVCHHIDKNGRNNNPNNVAVLCPNCHWIVHHVNGDFRTNIKGKRKRGANFERHRYVREHSKQSRKKET